MAAALALARALGVLGLGLLVWQTGWWPLRVQVALQPAVPASQAGSGLTAGPPVRLALVPGSAQLVAAGVFPPAVVPVGVQVEMTGGRGQVAVGTGQDEFAYGLIDAGRGPQTLVRGPQAPEPDVVVTALGRAFGPGTVTVVGLWLAPEARQQEGR